MRACTGQSPPIHCPDVYRDAHHAHVCSYRLSRQQLLCSRLAPILMNSAVGVTRTRKDLVQTIDQGQLVPSSSPVPRSSPRKSSSITAAGFLRTRLIDLERTALDI